VGAGRWRLISLLKINLNINKIENKKIGGKNEYT